MTTRPDSRKPIAVAKRLPSGPPLDGVRWRSETLGSWKLGFVALGFTSVFMGYNWVVAKVALDYAQPFTFAAMRAVLSTLILFALLVVLRRPMKPKALSVTIIYSLLYTTAPIGLMLWALETGAVGRVSVLTYLFPFWLLILAWIYLGERLHGLQWAAVSMAFIGLILVASPWRVSGVASSLMAIGTSLALAASTIVAKRLYRRSDIDLLSFTAWQMLFGSLPLIVIAALTWEGPPIWSPTFTWVLVYNVVPAGAVSWILWMYAFRVLRAGDAGIGTLLIPVIGVAAAWAQLGERPELAEAIGMALIVCGLAIITAREVFAGRQGVIPVPPP
jgi:drug/metabolite transporter (DMT)-like permease